MRDDAVFGESFLGQAAVVVLVDGDPESGRVLLTKRSAHLNAHAGEIAFPGGKWEPGDADLQATALRETHEEVGIAPSQVTLVGCLPSGQTGRGIEVTPFIATLVGDVELTPNPNEIADCFWVSRATLIADQRIRTDVFTIGGREFWSPVYDFDGHVVWGFTARVLVQFMNQYWRAGLSRSHKSAPTVHHRALVSSI